MKSLISFWQVVANELATWCDTCTARDVETLRVRSKNEGLSFLTITLPNFGSDLEKGLDQGFVDSSLFYGFRRKGGLPIFLSGFLRRIFDSKSGLLLEDPCVDSIFAVRQLTLMCKKMEIPCSPGREDKALESFVSCEKELKEIDSRLSEIDLSEFRRISAMLFGNTFDLINREVADFKLEPRHGPGATADKLRGNQKFVQTEWPERLESTFPYGEYVLPSWRYWNADSVQFLSPGQERPVKVTLVPKTLKTPRVIAIEPTAMQYAQQALLQSLVPKLESSSTSRSFVGFTDQEPNKLLAREGSRNGNLATLDLSEASDRVLNSLVLEMTGPWTDFSEAVQACRSRTAELPDGKRIRLSKFASMGSALCFPMEAMVFCTLVLMGIQNARSIRISRDSLREFHDTVRVYGDDIIVPVDCVTDVIASLETFGLKVNHSKSFWNGKFRESCGGDFYDGEDVRPLRLSQELPSHQQHVREIIALSDLGNSLFKRGLWRSADHVRKILEEILGSLPCISHESQAIGLHSFTGVTVMREDPQLHRPMVKAWVPTSKSPVSKLADHWGLRKVFSGDWSDPVFKEHLERAGRPSSVHIKRKWVPA